MWGQYNYGLLVVMVAAIIAFFALAREYDDFHKFLLLDLIEIPSLCVIALLGTDLAEALVLPGLTVGIAEQLALSQIYCVKQGIKENPVSRLNIEVVAEGRRTADHFYFPCCVWNPALGFYRRWRSRTRAGLLLCIPGIQREPQHAGDGERDLMGYLDLRVLCLHVPSPVLVYRTYGCCRGYRAQSDRQDVPCRDHVG